MLHGIHLLFPLIITPLPSCLLSSQFVLFLCFFCFVSFSSWFCLHVHLPVISMSTSQWTYGQWAALWLKWSGEACCSPALIVSFTASSLHSVWRDPTPSWEFPSCHFAVHYQVFHPTNVTSIIALQHQPTVKQNQIVEGSGCERGCVQWMCEQRVSRMSCFSFRAPEPLRRIFCKNISDNNLSPRFQCLYLLNNNNNNNKCHTHKYLQQFLNLFESKSTRN